jgi:hypothetical protein
VYTLPPVHLDPAAGRNITIVRPESSYEASHSPSGNTPSELWQEGFAYVVTDDWAAFKDPETASGRWELSVGVEGYQGVKLGRQWPFVTVRTGRRLAVMRRDEA